MEESPQAITCSPCNQYPFKRCDRYRAPDSTERGASSCKSVSMAQSLQCPKIVCCMPVRHHFWGTNKHHDSSWHGVVVPGRRFDSALPRQWESTSRTLPSDKLGTVRVLDAAISAAVWKNDRHLGCGLTTIAPTHDISASEFHLLSHVHLIKLKQHFTETRPYNFSRHDGRRACECPISHQPHGCA